MVNESRLLHMIFQNNISWLYNDLNIQFVPV